VFVCALARPSSHSPSFAKRHVLEHVARRNACPTRPQSAQSVPSEHARVWEFRRPSSHSPSRANWQVFSQRPAGTADVSSGGAADGCGLVETAGLAPAAATATGCSLPPVVGCALPSAGAVGGGAAVVATGTGGVVTGGGGGGAGGSDCPKGSESHAATPDNTNAKTKPHATIPGLVMADIIARNRREGHPIQPGRIFIALMGPRTGNCG
jgi:hypothetical protein